MDVSTGATQLWSAVQSTTGIAWDNQPLIWILVVGFIVAFILSFAVGANDVANSFGTTVGAEVLTLKQACVLATIFETAGAVLLGAKVGETIRKGITDVSVYNDVEDGAELLMLGELSAMFGSACWQLIATVFKLPVSGTHSIVGACIGFSLVAVGTLGINWTKLGLIVASWFISPVLSGLMAVGLFVLIDHVVLRRDNPLKTGLLLLPVFYGLTIGINFFSILFSGAPLLGFDKLPVWADVLIALGAILLTALLVQLLAVPRIRRKALAKKEEALKMEKTGPTLIVPCDSGYDTPCDKNTSANDTSIATALVNEVDDLRSDKQAEDDFRVSTESIQQGEKQLDKTSTPVHEDQWKREDSRCGLIVQDVEKQAKKNKKDKKEKKSKKEKEVEEEDEEEELEAPEVKELFSSLQVLTACFASFAHGGNDVSNAIGPLIALWIVFWSGEVVQKAFTPWYLLIYGGIGICVGLWILGRRVIETIGSDLTKVTPSRGFCIELMTAITVLIASNIGLPVSTTHCKVGAVVSIGWWRSRAAVDWSLARNIGVAWFVTVPVSGLLSAGAMWFLMTVAL